jgi:hypothetical protein
MLMTGIAASQISPARAADATADANLSAADHFALRAALSTRLAYVVTGDATVDETSRAGLTGLGQILLQRSAVEPAEPVGVDVEHDELTFFPVLYWPVTASAKGLSDAAVARVNGYMKGGGLIVFDTQEEGDALPADPENPGPVTAAFRRIASRLDIPRLQPVPSDHVLTKSFYLLKSFPGRFDTGSLWVEDSGGSLAEEGDRARESDGVSSVIVTGNDFAGAWAVDDSGQGLYAVVPGGEEQREYAYRAGVNIVMYALTGNYKADQVHVPAILERLGQ